ncbi:hypothetical protein LY76DRAFT_311131 [Colletotrichum caudatum]|nr:hypothetical protein LY76DRAFT_311131 [Colletotrichum caudatum]
MSSGSTSDNILTFGHDTKAAFSRYLEDNPNPRRVSQDEKIVIHQWLTDPEMKSSSQKESSRRNYVRKTFVWDDRLQAIYALPKGSRTERREVITEDRILDIVASIHGRNGHPGWDATWKAVNDTYYGILRADVIFLLKRCPVCSQDPRKQPKGISVTSAPHLEYDHDFFRVDELLIGNPAFIDSEFNADKQGNV